MAGSRNPDLREHAQYWWQESQRTVSMAVVCVCMGLFVVVALGDVLRVISRDTAVSYLGLSWYGAVHKRLFYQFVTSAFLHANVTHLLFNMLALWMLGPGVEKKLGRGNYILFSAVSGLSAMVAFVLANWGTTHIALGYSGIIFGILVAQAKFFPDHRIMFFLFFPMKMRYAVLILGAIELYLTVSPEESAVGHLSHLAGAVAAVAYLALWQAAVSHGDRKIRKKKSPRAIAAVRKARLERQIPKKL